MKKLILITTVPVLFFACSEHKKATPHEDSSSAKTYQNVEKNNGYPTDVFFGDTHLHTELSLDAGIFGNTLGLDDAYRFARGEEVTSSTGIKTKLSRPLDFLVIADHSDAIGLYQSVLSGDDWLMQYEEGRRWYNLIKEGKRAEATMDLVETFAQGEIEMDVNDPEIQTSVWESVVDAADKYNEPGIFTAFIGYEWSAMVKGDNLHRVVIYRDGKERAIQKLPANTNGNQVADPETLWEYMEDYELRTGGQVIAIPHNGNQSNGIMFMAETKFNGDPFDENYVKNRIRWEPLYEVTQMKGDGETHPFLSPNDEFADYETWDKTNGGLSAVKTNDMLAGEYAREALKQGLKIKNELGTNPYKFGLIGSTDSHTSLATADDDNFFGKSPLGESGKDRWKKTFSVSSVVPDLQILYWEMMAAGYAAVWAQENTRESIFDAMQRKETYATTGPRMKVRFFGGFDFDEDDLNGDWVKNGYEKGVPMGGDLSRSEKAPSFIIQSSMDPEGGTLDRIQVIKGWANPDGTLGEKIYNVIWAGNRALDENGNIPPIENTVSLADATWDNSTGSAELRTVWTDPDFNPELEAFYYVRILEIPTPRWTLYDVIRMGSEMPEEVPMTTQQRAYTSPIWYSPN